MQNHRSAFVASGSVSRPDRVSRLCASRGRGRDGLSDSGLPLRAVEKRCLRGGLPIPTAPAVRPTTAGIGSASGRVRTSRDESAAPSLAALRRHFSALCVTALKVGPTRSGRHGPGETLPSLRRSMRSAAPAPRLSEQISRTRIRTGAHETTRGALGSSLS